jgi:hypothetical protein
MTFFQHHGVFLLSEKAEAIAAGLAHSVVAVLPNIPIRALKLGDRISLTGVARGAGKG